MRTIKFRAIKDDMSDFRFVYGSLIYDYKDNPRIQEDSNEPTFTTCVEGSECQFTGLKDKNGKEIYEGDIVDVWSAGSHLTNGIIKFGQGSAKFFIGNKSNSICWNLSGGGDDYTHEDLKVIGNIHENPELLNP